MKQIFTINSHQPVCRSSRPEVFHKKGVFGPATLSKRDYGRGVFLGTPFLTEQLWLLLLTNSLLQSSKKLTKLRLNEKPLSHFCVFLWILWFIFRVITLYNLSKQLLSVIGMCYGCILCCFTLYLQRKTHIQHPAMCTWSQVI